MLACVNLDKTIHKILRIILLTCLKDRKRDMIQEQISTRFRGQKCRTL